MGANFIIPGLYEHYALNFKLLDLMENHPEYFIDDISVSAVYGSFQFCIFDGGRIFQTYRHTSKEEIDLIVNTYNQKFNVPVRLVLTNTEIQEKDFTNRFGNVVLDICENDLNEVVINNETFEKYVREHYPKYQFISSTTKCLNTPQLFKNELDKQQYKMICLDYNLNKNKKLLESIPQERRGECEFLVNAICPPGCPNRKEHYKLNSLFSLKYGQYYTIQNCPIQHNTLFPSNCNSANNISPEEIYNYYVPNGFNLFKLEGRTLTSIENACNYVKYMVKPEYQFYVLQLLLEDSCIHKDQDNLKFLRGFVGYEK